MRDGSLKENFWGSFLRLFVETAAALTAALFGAWFLIPLAVRARGYFAVGGEIILVLLLFAFAFAGTAALFRLLWR